MDNIKETFKRNVNPEKLAKLKRNKLLESFVKGSDYEEDFEYLKEELPEFLDSFYVNDNWIDKKGFYREVKNDYYLICESKNGSQFVIGEVKFDPITKKPIFGRFSETGMFSRLDNLIVDGKEIIRGTVPETEWLYPTAKKDPPYFYSYEYSKTDKSRLNLEYRVYSKKLNIAFWDYVGKRIKLYIDYNTTPFNVSYRVEEYELVVKAMEYAENPTKKVLKEGVLGKDKSKFDKELINIRDSYYEFINNDFKNENLKTYIDMYKACEKIIAMY